MMKAAYIISVLLVLGLAHCADAALDQADLKAVGEFLVLDFASLTEDNAREPLTGFFWVKETGLTQEITEEEAQRPKCVAAGLTPGQYRHIMIINEVSGLGALVRYAYINQEHRVFWSADDQSLLRLALRPELGNTGVCRLTEIPPEYAAEGFLEGWQQGEIPTEYVPGESDQTLYKASIGVIWSVLVTRPAPES